MSHLQVKAVSCEVAGNVVLHRANAWQSCVDSDPRCVVLALIPCKAVNRLPLHAFHSRSGRRNWNLQGRGSLAGDGFLQMAEHGISCLRRTV